MPASAKHLFTAAEWTEVERRNAEWAGRPGEPYFPGESVERATRRKQLGIDYEAWLDAIRAKDPAAIAAIPDHSDATAFRIARVIDVETWHDRRTTVMPEGGRVGIVIVRVGGSPLRSQLVIDHGGVKMQTPAGSAPTYMFADGSTLTCSNTETRAAPPRSERELLGMSPEGEAYWRRELARAQAA